jgi:hypothetical protein
LTDGCEITQQSGKYHFLNHPFKTGYLLLQGMVPEAACAIKAFDSPDDGPIGPKHVEIDKKPRL